MIAYEVLVQTIADWKAGVRPTLPTPAVPAQPEVVEEIESGVLDLEPADEDVEGEPMVAEAGGEAGYGEEVPGAEGAEALADYGQTEASDHGYGDQAQAGAGDYGAEYGMNDEGQAEDAQADPAQADSAQWAQDPAADYGQAEVEYAEVQPDDDDEPQQ